jgi:hypothetical protein
MAFTYTWTAIPDTDTDPDSPLTTGLMTGINHNLTYNREWLGKDYYAGAVPNHDHDGINSTIAAVRGAGLLATHMMEIHDHFAENAVDSSMWTITSTPTVVPNGHYCELAAGEAIDSKFSWRIDQVKMIFEARVRSTPATTTWAFTELGILSSAGARQAIFDNPSVADKVRCRTVGGGGTEDTDVAVGGGGIDAWHIYKIDQTSSTQTLFYLDGTLIATHATRVPDGQDLTVRIGGSSNVPKVDYVRGWVTENPISTA